MKRFGRSRLAVALSTLLTFVIRCETLVTRGICCQRLAGSSQGSFRTSRKFSAVPLYASNNDMDVSSAADAMYESINFQSLATMGLKISSEMFNRNAIPHHLTTARDIFCNREVNMEQIDVIGFDMDFTLAMYNREFDLLAYNGAKEKLVSWLNYPQDVLQLEYEEHMCRRGCIVDKMRGNILKLDQHRYVRDVEHGLTRLSSAQRKRIYRESFQEFETFSGPNFANIDTPFSLVDACLFAQLVDLRDQVAQRQKSTGASEEMFGTDMAEAQQAELVLARKSYLQLWSDMRKCVDRCHKDGVIKHIVAENPAKYIEYDPNLFPMFQQFRESGRQLFVLTNSLWDYTQVVMNYLQGGAAKSQAQDRDLQWIEYFDLVVVGGNKPAFLLDEKGALSLYKVEPTSGKLSNIEVHPTNSDEVHTFLQQHGKVYQGGNAKILHRLLNLRQGDSLLYVGDHIYSDILRSKRSLGWRTCLIVPELVREIPAYKKLRGMRVEVLHLRKCQFLLEDVLDRLRTKIVFSKQKPFSVSTGSDEQDALSLVGVNLDLSILASFEQLEAMSRAGTSEAYYSAKDTSRSLSLLRKFADSTLQLRARMQQTLAHDSSAQPVTTPITGFSAEQFQMLVQVLEEDLQSLRMTTKTRLAQYDKAFHWKWGQLFKAGFQESRFSKQVKDFACLYTSQVSNLGQASSLRPFRPARDLMPHDHFAEGF